MRWTFRSWRPPSLSASLTKLSFSIPNLSLSSLGRYTRPRLSMMRYISFAISVVLHFDDDAAMLHGVGQVVQVEKTGKPQ